LQYFWNNVKHNHYVQNFIKYNVDHWNHDTNEYRVPNDRYKALKMLPIERIVGNWKHNKPVGAAVIKYFNYEDYDGKGVLDKYNVFYPGESYTLKQILPDNYYYSMEIESIIPKLKSTEIEKIQELNNLQDTIDSYVPPKVIVSKSTVGARAFFAGLGMLLAGSLAAPFIAAAAVATPFVLLGAIETVKWIGNGAERRAVIAPGNDTVKLGYLEKRDQTTEELRLLHSMFTFIGSDTETIHSAGGYNKFSKINKQRRRNISKRIFK
jgi:hypothetical protein